MLSEDIMTSKGYIDSAKPHVEAEQEEVAMVVEAYTVVQPGCSLIRYVIYLIFSMSSSNSSYMLEIWVYYFFLCYDLFAGSLTSRKKTITRETKNEIERFFSANQLKGDTKYA